MALSKPEWLNKISNDGDLTINTMQIRKYCEVTYTSAISLEIIEHLLGGQNMEYITMELENSFQCYDYCHRDLLNDLQEKKQEIGFFKDRKNSASSVLIVVTSIPEQTNNENTSDLMPL